MALQKQAMQSKINQESQMMASQAAMQKLQAETQAKMQIKQAEIAFEIEKMNNEAQLEEGSYGAGVPIQPTASRGF